MKKIRETPLTHGGYYHIYNRGNNGETLFYSPENYYHFLRLYEKYIEPIADTYAWCLMGNHFHLLVRVKEEGEIGCLVDFNSSRSGDSGRLKWRTPNNLPESAGPGSVIGLESGSAIRLSGLGSVIGLESGSAIRLSGPGSAIGLESGSDLNASRSSDSGRLNQSGRLKWETSNNLPESVGPGSVIDKKKPIPHRMFGHLFNSYTKYLNLKIGRTGSLFEKNFHRIPINSDKYFRNLVVYIHQNPFHHGFTDDFRDYPWSSYGSFISEKITKMKRKEVLDWFDGRENFINIHRVIVDGVQFDQWTEGF